MATNDKSKKTTAKKKAAAKKAPAKKTAAKKVATKKTTTKKAAATKKAPAKKAASKKKASSVTTTTIIAKVDVGFGNLLYIRGDGEGLSWDMGIQMQNTAADEWTLSSTGIKKDFACKFLINDETWSEGEDVIIRAGEKSVIVPSF